MRVGPDLLGRQPRNHMHGDRLQTQPQRGFETGFPHHEHAVLGHHQRLAKPELRNGAGYRLHGRIVVAGIVFVGDDIAQPEVLDLHHLFLSTQQEMASLTTIAPQHFVTTFDALPKKKRPATKRLSTKGQVFFLLRAAACYGLDPSLETLTGFFRRSEGKNQKNVMFDPEKSTRR